MRKNYVLVNLFISQTIQAVSFFFHFRYAQTKLTPKSGDERKKSNRLSTERLKRCDLTQAIPEKSLISLRTWFWMNFDRLLSLNRLIRETKRYSVVDMLQIEAESFAWSYTSYCRREKKRNTNTHKHTNTHRTESRALCLLSTSSARDWTWPWSLECAESRVPSGFVWISFALCCGFVQFPASGSTDHSHAWRIQLLVVVYFQERKKIADTNSEQTMRKWFARVWSYKEKWQDIFIFAVAGVSDFILNVLVALFGQRSWLILKTICHCQRFWFTGKVLIGLIPNWKYAWNEPAPKRVEIMEFCTFRVHR